MSSKLASSRLRARLWVVGAAAVMFILWFAGAARASTTSSAAAAAGCDPVEVSTTTAPPTTAAPTTTVPPTTAAPTTTTPPTTVPPTTVAPTTTAPPTTAAPTTTTAPPTTVPAPADPLATWRAALAGSAQRPASVLVVGDSIAEGWSANDRADWWVTRLRTTLQAGRGGGTGYVPALPGSGTPPFSPKWTFSPAATSMGTGLGLRSALITAGGTATVSDAATDQVDLLYSTGPQYGRMKIAVDGVDVATVDTTTATPTAGQRWRSPLLPLGAHTVTITPVAGGDGVVRAVTVDGAFFFAGDQAKGVHMWEGAKVGAGTYTFATNTSWLDAIPAVDPDLVVIELGVNDWAYGTTGADTERYLNSIVDGIYARTGRRPSVVLVPIWTTADRDQAAYRLVLDAERKVATDRGLAVADLSAVDASLITTDGIHPSSLGNQLMADRISAAVDPAYVPYATPAPVTAVRATAGATPGSVAVDLTLAPGSTGAVVRVVDDAGAVVGQQVVTGSSATFTGLLGGRTYAVRAYAVNGGALNSTATSTSVAVVDQPAVTSVAVASDAASATISASWPVATGASYYEVVLAKAGAPTVAVSQLTTGATSASFSGVQVGQPYVVSVVVHGPAGLSPATTSNQVTIAAGGPPAVAVTPTGAAGAVDVTWVPPANQANAVVQLWDMTMKTLVGQVTVTTIGKASFASLTGGRGYAALVYFIDAAGGVTTSSSPTTTLPSPPGAMAAPTLVAGSTARSLVATWKAPSGTVSGYVVQLFDVTDNTNSVVNTTSTTATFTGLKSGHRYAVMVYGSNQGYLGTPAASGYVTVA